MAFSKSRKQRNGGTTKPGRGDSEGRQQNPRRRTKAARATRVRNPGAEPRCGAGCGRGCGLLHPGNWAHFGGRAADSSTRPSSATTAMIKTRDRARARSSFFGAEADRTRAESQKSVKAEAHQLHGRAARVTERHVEANVAVPTARKHDVGGGASAQRRGLERSARGAAAERQRSASARVERRMESVERRANPGEGERGGEG